MPKGFFFNYYSRDQLLGIKLNTLPMLDQCPTFKLCPQILAALGIKSRALYVLSKLLLLSCSALSLFA